MELAYKSVWEVEKSGMKGHVVVVGKIVEEKSNSVMLQETMDDLTMVNAQRWVSDAVI